VSIASYLFGSPKHDREHEPVRGATLKPCPTCNQSCSSAAASCPNCGHPLRQASRGQMGGFTLFVIIVIAIIVAGFFLVVFNDINRDADRLLRQANISTR
jgi:hypothetical protein